MATRSRASIKLQSTPLIPWINDLDRLSREPTAKTKTALDAVVLSAYTQSQLNVHVMSGRLRTSGRVQTDVGRRSRYTAEIGYGLGVPYAKYELGPTNQRRGPRVDWVTHPDHDPLSGLDMYYAEVDAVLKALM